MHLSRSWRTPLLSVLVVPCFAFMASSEEPQDRFIEDCIAKIRAYEGLYRTSRITVNVNADDHSPPDLESIRMEVTVDGERMRYDERAVYANKPDELNTIVSDGERLKAWSRRETNRFGQGTVKPHEKNEVRAWSHSLYFRPCESYAFLSYPQIERVSHESREVTLSFYHPEYDQRYVVRYEECGEYMRPLFLDQQLSDKKNRAPGAGIQYKYTYRDKRVKDGGEIWPIRIETRSKSHGFTEIYEVKDVDFEPQIEEVQFDLEFPDGAWVTDETLGISQRYFKAGVPASQITETLLEEMEGDVEDKHHEELIEAREKELEVMISEMPAADRLIPSNLWGTTISLLCILPIVCFVAVKISRKR